MLPLGAPVMTRRPPLDGCGRADPQCEEQQALSFSDESPTLRLDEATRVWDLLEQQVEGLVNAWESGGDPPDLASFVPSDPPGMRRLALVELIKVDLEYRWQRRGLPQQVEEYVAAFPELADDNGVPADLIYEEFYVRSSTDSPPTPDEYFERFPAQRDELKRLMGLNAPHATTAMCARDRLPEVSVGDKLDEFQLLAELGSGAFATVFLARQETLQRLVALKVSADRGTEPQTLAQLDHPHIVRVYDQRVLDDPKVRLLYMQYVAGGTLQRVVELVRKVPPGERSGRLLLEAVNAALDDRGESPPADSSARARLAQCTWPEAVCWLGIRLASALAYAHRRGVLHRDIKPANVLLAADATPKLVDFNISFSSALDGATPAAYFGGSLAYMSPEQLEACNPKHPRQPGELDARADIFSLGVVLWELLTGERPYRDEQLDAGWTQTLEAMVNRRRVGVEKDVLSKLPRSVQPGMQHVLLDCLASDAADRIESGDELARQLSLCMQPHAQRLMRPARLGWQSLVRRFPTISLSLAALVPNVVISIFNILYNFDAIVKRLEDEKLVYFFWNVMLGPLNIAAYGLGILLAIGMGLPVVLNAHKLRHGRQLPAEDLPRIRRRCLELGDLVAWIVVVLWSASGIAIPIGLEVGSEAPTGLGWEVHLHLVVSQVLCGVITATLTFYCMTLMAVRALYPLFLRAGSIVPRDQEGIRFAGRRVWLHFGLSVSVPFIAVIVLVLSNPPQELRWAQVVLGIFGLLSFGLVFWMSRLIQTDLAALSLAVGPPRDNLATSETWDSFLTGSGG